MAGPLEERRSKTEKLETKLLRTRKGLREEVCFTHPLGWAWSAATVSRSDSLYLTSLRAEATGDWPAEFPPVA